MNIVVYTEKEDARFVDVDRDELSLSVRPYHLSNFIVLAVMEYFKGFFPQALKNTNNTVFLPIAIISNDSIKNIFLYRKCDYGMFKDIAIVRELCNDGVITEEHLSKRYMCYAVGQSCPKYIHENYESASKEALRLSSMLETDVVLYAEIFTFNIHTDI